MPYRPEYPVTSPSKPFPAGDIDSDWPYDATIGWIESMSRPPLRKWKQQRAERLIDEVQAEWTANTPLEQRMVHGRALALTHKLDRNQPDASTTRGYLAAHSAALAKGALPVDYDPSLYHDLGLIDSQLSARPSARREFSRAAWRGMQYSHEMVGKLLGTLNGNLVSIYDLNEQQRAKQKLGIALFYTAATHGHLLTTMPDYSAMRRTDVDLTSNPILHLEDMVTDEIPLATRDVDER